MKISTAPNATPKSCPPCSWPTRERHEPNAEAERRVSNGVVSLRWLISKVA